MARVRFWPLADISYCAANVRFDAHVDGRHAAAGLPDQRPIGGEIDQRRENAAMGETTLDADHPFLAPFRTDLN